MSRQCFKSETSVEHFAAREKFVMEVRLEDVSLVRIRISIIIVSIKDHHCDQGARQRRDRRRLLLCHSSSHTSSIALAHQQVEGGDDYDADCSSNDLLYFH